MGQCAPEKKKRKRPNSRYTEESDRKSKRERISDIPEGIRSSTESRRRSITIEHRLNAINEALNKPIMKRESTALTPPKNLYFNSLDDIFEIYESKNGESIGDIYLDTAESPNKLDRIVSTLGSENDRNTRNPVRLLANFKLIFDEKTGEVIGFQATQRKHNVCLGDLDGAQMSCITLDKYN